MKLGAAGYVLKNRSTEQLINAMYQVYSRNSYFGLDVLKELTNLQGLSAIEEIVKLPNRETQVLSLLGEALSAKEIPMELGINETTVNTHKQSLRVKLDMLT